MQTVYNCVLNAECPSTPSYLAMLGDSPGNNMLKGTKNEITEKINHCENNNHSTTPNVYMILYICPLASVGGTGSRVLKPYVEKCVTFGYSLRTSSHIL